MKCVSIYSRCKAADPVLSIWAALRWVLREAAGSITDGRFICRERIACAGGIMATRLADAAAASRPAAFKAALVCRGVSAVGQGTFRRLTAAPVHACATIYFVRQHRTAQRAHARNQGQREAVRPAF